MHILITGGSGFIGSNLIHRLLKTPSHSLLNYDKQTAAANPLSLRSFRGSPQLQQVCACISDGETLLNTLEHFQPQVVLHTAVESSQSTGFNNPNPWIQTNLIGTYTLLEAVRTYWQGLPARQQAAFRLLYLYSDQVYGNPHQLELRINEQTPLNPESPYSTSKASAEQLALGWHQSYGLPLMITRAARTYGPRQATHHTLPRLLRLALVGQELGVGHHQHPLDWLYVEDHVSALLEVMRSGQPGEVYNISSAQQHSLADLACTLCDLLDELKPAATSYRNLITYADAQPGFTQKRSLDSSKLRQLGWAPEYSLEQGLRTTLNWYLNNPDWVEKSISRLSGRSRVRQKKRREIKGI